ncbi:hypothetical protein K402DRAFT_163051 [Aulographum hederae CBS 113979]|uniref:Uncharacterized protein n=1 Tax=Aulographum hederae CBS 113979 TaxID=1176131 RepID=A0A6G1GRS0_9PEZI|nr:hypothetical protein K402DRAFT_163051 [Aulographum hederae CBS 113979]
MALYYLTITPPGLWCDFHCRQRGCRWRRGILIALWFLRVVLHDMSGTTGTVIRSFIMMVFAGIYLTSLCGLFREMRPGDWGDENIYALIWHRARYLSIFVLLRIAYVATMSCVVLSERTGAWVIIGDAWVGTIFQILVWRCCKLLDRTWFFGYWDDMEKVEVERRSNRLPSQHLKKTLEKQFKLKQHANPKITTTDLQPPNQPNPKLPHPNPDNHRHRMDVDMPRQPALPSRRLLDKPRSGVADCRVLLVRFLHSLVYSSNPPAPFTSESGYYINNDNDRNSNRSKDNNNNSTQP